MNHLDLQTTTEQRRAERGRRRTHTTRGETKRSIAGERQRDDEPRGFGGAVRAPLGGFGRRNDDGDQSERSEYEREERARGGGRVATKE
jgi:hypothetical protein